jgi:hypothetical protein
MVTADYQSILRKTMVVGTLKQKYAVTIDQSGSYLLVSNNNALTYKNSLWCLHRKLF